MRLGLISRLILFLAFFVSVSKSSFAQNAVTSIENISFSQFSNEIDINIDLNKMPSYKVFLLEEPYRLVIDVENSSIKANVNISNIRLFDNFRIGNKEGGAKRLVFDLRKKSSIIRSTISKPNSGNTNYKLNIKISLPVLESDQPKKYSLTPLDNLIANKILNNDNKTQKLTIKKSPAKTTSLKSKKTKSLNKRKKVVVIDAGHGGKDPGAIGRYAKTREKNVTLAFARDIKKYLEKDNKFVVHLTRNSDYFISLAGRVKKSRKLKADLFISIHADSAENKKASGLSIYTLSETSSDKEAEKLAKKENKADIIGGINFSGTSGDILKTLVDLSQRDTMNNSAKFANFSIKRLAKNGIKVRKHTHRFAGFRVLTAPDIPSVLIELGYLSNKLDEKKLNSSYYRRNFAKVMSKIIQEYFKNPNG